MTQGPIESTIKDFRNMLKSERVDCVVMLCRLIEGGKNRCADYLDELEIGQ
jgi:protein tyrosine phosphatase